MRRSVSVCSSDDPTPPATNSITEALRVRSPCREQQLAAGPTLAAAEWPRVNSAAALSDFWRRTAALLWVLILAGHLLTAPGAKAEAHWAGLQHERPGVSWQRWADWYHSVLAFASNSGLRPYSERHQRTLANTNTSACRNFAQCLSLTPHTVADICSEVKLSRIGCLRRLNLFGPSPCLQRYQLNLENLFLLHVRDSHELEDPTLLTHLTPDTIADCLLSGSGAPACHRCFAQLLNVIDRVQLAFEQFDMVLKQVDCRPGQEEIFSLRSSCEECQVSKNSPTILLFVAHQPSQQSPFTHT